MHGVSGMELHAALLSAAIGRAGAAAVAANAYWACRCGRTMTSGRLQCLERYEATLPRPSRSSAPTCSAQAEWQAQSIGHSLPAPAPQVGSRLHRR